MNKEQFLLSAEKAYRDYEESLSYQDKFQHGLRLLVETNLSQRQMYMMNKFGEALDRSFFNEFCTVSYSSARRMGHTFSSVKVASEFFDNIMYIGMHLEMFNSVKKFIDSFDKIVESDKYSFSTESGKKFTNASPRSMQGRARGLNEIQCVILDTYSMLSNKEEILSTVSSYCYVCPEKFLCMKIQ